MTLTETVSKPAIDKLSDELIIMILTYLRAMDFVGVTEVDKTVFSKQRVSTAIQRIMQAGQTALINTSPFKKQLNLANTLYRPDSLYVFEITSINAALAFPQPLPGKGYWISQSWASNAKKYFEALNLPEIDPSPRKNAAKKKQQAKIRQRRGSDALPPWPMINADLVCPHDGLALAKNPKSRRRPIDSRAWFVLRRYYPDGPQYKCNCSTECVLCYEEDEEAKAEAAGKREAEIVLRRGDFVPPKLRGVEARKSGVPQDCLTNRFLGLYEGLEDELDTLHLEAISGNDGNTMPLLSGLYNVIPRQWMKQWRRYLKDPSVPNLPPLDCSRLLCSAHGLFMIPPHLEEYLLGVRRYLLAGLGSYPGEVVEIVSADEWDELTKIMHHFSDFSLRFCVDGSEITWNHGVCNVCDPFNYSRPPTVAREPGPNSQHRTTISVRA